MVARTLVSDNARCRAVRVINVNDCPVEVDGGACVGEAEIHHGCVIQQLHRVPQQTDTYGDSDAYEHLKSIIDFLPSSLLAEQRQQAIKLIKRNADVFCRSEYNLGRTPLVQHRIDVGQNRPFKEPLRRHPKAYLEEIDNQVEQMMKNDIIENAASPWASNIVLVVKKPEIDSEGRGARKTDNSFLQRLRQTEFNHGQGFISSSED